MRRVLGSKVSATQEPLEWLRLGGQPRPLARRSRLRLASKPLKPSGVREREAIPLQLVATHGNAGSVGCADG